MGLAAIYDILAGYQETAIAAFEPKGVMGRTIKGLASKHTLYRFDPNAFAPVTTAGVFGDAGRNILRGPCYFNLDMSLMRNFKLLEWLTLQFEAEAFGVTNTPHFNNPNANISGANFGAVTSTLVTTNASLGGTGGQRQWWFGGKLLF